MSESIVERIKLLCQDLQIFAEELEKIQLSQTNRMNLDIQPIVTHPPNIVPAGRSGTKYDNSILNWIKNLRGIL